MKKIHSLYLAAATFALSAAFIPARAADAKTSFKVCWSHYVGWEPWGYAQASGALAKAAAAEGIKVEAVLVNDYVGSIEQFTVNAFDGCTMTNMDALTIPVAAGKPTEVVIVGDYSNGNDGIVAKKLKSVAELKGQSVLLVDGSVSQYLLSRALEKSKVSPDTVTRVNTSDADITAVFGATPGATVVTWNPMLADIKAGGTTLFDSSQIPGEILDLMVTHKAADPRMKRALAKAWYSVLAQLKQEAAAAAPPADGILAWMAKSSGTDIAGIKAQLAATFMYWTPAEAVQFTESAAPRNTMEHVRTFAFSNGLFGTNVKKLDDIGLSFAAGQKNLGTAKPTYIWTADWMKAAAAP